MEIEGSSVARYSLKINKAVEKSDSRQIKSEKNYKTISVAAFFTAYIWNQVALKRHQNAIVIYLNEKKKT